jgi:hypothetical protein
LDTHATAGEGDLTKERTVTLVVQPENGMVKPAGHGRSYRLAGVVLSNDLKTMQLIIESHLPSIL